MRFYELRVNEILESYLIRFCKRSDRLIYTVTKLDEIFATRLTRFLSQTLFYM